LIPLGLGLLFALLLLLHRLPALILRRLHGLPALILWLLLHGFPALIGRLLLHRLLALIRRLGIRSGRSAPLPVGDYRGA
jgi:hypothetical protein